MSLRVPIPDVSELLFKLESVGNYLMRKGAGQRAQWVWELWHSVSEARRGK